MAPIVAPGICRFAVEGRIAGAQYANVLHYRFFQISGGDRADVCYEHAGDIMNNWDDHIRGYQSDQITLERVTWLDLDSLDGSKGERSSTADTTWPAVGGQSETMSANVSMRANKNGTASRGQRTGRLYLGPPQEGWTDSPNINNLDAGSVANWNTALEAFRGGTEGEDGFGDLGSYDSGMVVVHTRNGVYQSYSDVTALVMQSKLATMRGRMD